MNMNINNHIIINIIVYTINDERSGRKDELRCRDPAINALTGGYGSELLLFLIRFNNWFFVCKKGLQFL